MKFRFLYSLVIALCGTPFSMGGPFSPAAGQPGSNAISRLDPRIVGWAERVEAVEFGEALSEEWKNTERALGPAGDNVMEVMSLGRGGEAVLRMALPIIDRSGPDFVVFSNGFSNWFLELAFVEVSSDGDRFVRFPNVSLTEEPVPAFGMVDPTKVDGLAGKFRIGWGVPFDLAELRGLPGAEALNFQNIRYVRVVDVVGGTNPDFSELPQSVDSEGRPVYDPFPTVGSAGFDLDGVAVFHTELEAEAVAAGIRLSWRSEGGYPVRLMQSEDLVEWTQAEVLPVSESSERSHVVGLPETGSVFYRIEVLWEPES